MDKNNIETNMAKVSDKRPLFFGLAFGILFGFLQ